MKTCTASRQGRQGRIRRNKTCRMGSLENSEKLNSQRNVTSCPGATICFAAMFECQWTGWKKFVLFILTGEHLMRSKVQGWMFFLVISKQAAVKSISPTLKFIFNILWRGKIFSFRVKAKLVASHAVTPEKNLVTSFFPGKAEILTLQKLLHAVITKKYFLRLCFSGKAKLMTSQSPSVCAKLFSLRKITFVTSYSVTPEKYFQMFSSHFFPGKSRKQRLFWLLGTIICFGSLPLGPVDALELCTIR